MAKAAVKKKVAKTKAGFLNTARDDKLSKDWGKAIEEAKRLANDNKPSSKTKTKTRTPRGTPRGGGSFTAEVYDETMRVGKSRASQVGGALLRGGLRWAGPVGALVSMTEPAGEGSDKPSGPLMRGNADRGPQRPRYKPPSGPKNRQPLPKNKSLATAAGTLTSPYEPRSKTAKSEGPGRMGSQTITTTKTRSSVGGPGAARALEDRPSVAATAATAANKVNGAAPKGTTPAKRYKNARERRMAERYAIGTSGRPM